MRSTLPLIPLALLLTGCLPAPQARAPEPPLPPVPPVQAVDPFPKRPERPVLPPRTGPLEPAPQPGAQMAAATSAPAPEAGPNASVNDSLNLADQMFKIGMDGCSTVSNALIVVNNPSIYGPINADQRAQLRAYAQRCGLRY